MSREIIEAVRMLESEKGISGEDLLTALEDALLAAYKKTPDAVPFARVEIDRDKGTFQIHQFVGEERTVPFNEIVRCKLVVADPFAAAAKRKGMAQ